MNTSNEIIVANSKILKLNNVVSRAISAQDQEEMQKTMQMFNSYFKSKMLIPYGPIIVHSKTSFNNGALSQKTEMMVQVREAPDKIDAPYSFESHIRIENCVMARYCGDPMKVQMAYGKIQVYAFENDVQLKDETYTVFVEQIEGVLNADVFVEVLK